MFSARHKVDCLLQFLKLLTLLDVLAVVVVVLLLQAAKGVTV